ncbi:JAB1/Mov34/MPN/PAD-1 [Artemisia annua]|uniref:JAB1/Mov34/MPN/PAD-1 n=1 Tax=Artemisia annua TaxID=35608 RepID=A0A2U1MNW7_ARTAN|nr:JAB1/Mov34/MPN/PAD-1 [Artemisia annua]
MTMFSGSMRSHHNIDANRTLLICHLRNHHIGVGFFPYQNRFTEACVHRHYQVQYTTYDLSSNDHLRTVQYTTYDLSSSDHLRSVSLQNSAYPDLPLKLALQLSAQSDIPSIKDSNSGVDTMDSVLSLDEGRWSRPAAEDVFSQFDVDDFLSGNIRQPSPPVLARLQPKYTYISIAQVVYPLPGPANLFQDDAHTTTTYQHLHIICCFKRDIGEFITKDEVLVAVFRHSASKDILVFTLWYSSDHVDLLYGLLIKIKFNLFLASIGLYLCIYEMVG